MNHKRRRPKTRRAGCLMCKPWKVSGTHPEALESEKFSDHKRRVAVPLDRRSLARELEPIV